LSIVGTHHGEKPCLFAFRTVFTSLDCFDYQQIRRIHIIAPHYKKIVDGVNPVTDAANDKVGMIDMVDDVTLSIPAASYVFHGNATITVRPDAARQVRRRRPLVGHIWSKCSHALRGCPCRRRRRTADIGQMAQNSPVSRYTDR